jgi:D-arabinose 1-dehydrogenase-like Zn-dependent alcohol dehydrogenase
MVEIAATGVCHSDLSVADEALDRSYGASEQETRA